MGEADRPGTAYATHSLRPAKVSLLYRKTGNLRARQLLLGHTNLESTVRYLGVELDPALETSAALVKNTHGIMLGIVRAEGVGADHFRQRSVSCAGVVSPPPRISDSRAFTWH